MKNHKLFILLILTFSVSNLFPQITKYTLEPTGLTDVYGFGKSVAKYGEYALIGAPGTHSNGIYNQGAAMVYKKNGDWTLVQMIFPSDSIVGNGFGRTVAMSNEFILATCGSTISEKSIYFFKLNNSNIWEEYQILTDAPIRAQAIEISGNYAIIGGFYGQCYMYYYNGNSWVRQQNLTGNSFLHELDVSIDGEYAIVGARRHNNNMGIALLFKRDGDVWNIQDTLTASDAHFDDHFGYSVSIDGNYIAVGANRHNDGIGAAYIFKRDGSDWIEEGILTDSQISADFGSSVSIKENYVVVTATFVGGISYLRIFNKLLDDWNLIYGDQVNGAFGYQTAISNNFILSGYHDMAQYNKVYIYEGLNISAVEEIEEVPAEYKLSYNFPNPFNPTTIIQYQIPELSFVTLKVYDVLGKEIATLIKEEKSVGNYEVEFNATALPSGIYFYRLQAGSFVETKKMVLMK